MTLVLCSIPAPKATDAAWHPGLRFLKGDIAHLRQVSGVGNGLFCDPSTVCTLEERMQPGGAASLIESTAVLYDGGSKTFQTGEERRHQWG